MLAVQQVSGPLGVVLGYIFTAVSKKMGKVNKINLMNLLFIILISGGMLAFCNQY